MKAVILAAGMGSRLKKLTQNNPKCMVEVNGETLIKRALKQLDNLKLDEIVLVLGYRKDILKDYIKTLNLETKVSYIDNDVYDKTNNIYSLYLAKDIMLNNDILLLESDLIFEENILKRLVNSNLKNIAVIDKYEPWMDGTCVQINADETITRMILGKDFNFKNTDSLYKTVNIYKFSKEFNKSYISFIEAYMNAQGKNGYYESVLETLIQVLPGSLKGLVVQNEKWYEIDDKQDLDIANSIFTTSEDKLSKMQKRYGGYWRYPKLIDFCYLVNPYFPPKKMIDELKMNFEILLREYPSGLNVNNLLASKYFNIDENYIVVGNGAAELIKVVMNSLKGTTGFIRPTFEEYPNRYSKDQIIFYPKTKGFKYTASDIMEFFNAKEINSLILINPDNPSGNYIPKNELINILKWSKEKEINILLDESFVDFASYENATLLMDDILKEFKNLIVVKSISKSYGVPGLRLGVLASSNIQLINKIKKEVSIWNINSFGEYYMQIFGKYEKTYKASLDKIKQARNIFIKDLKEIKELEVYDSEANYILVKVKEKYTSKELTEILLKEYELFIKDLKGKAGIDKNYIRIAVRDIHDNKVCIEKLKEVFSRG